MNQIFKEIDDDLKQDKYLILLKRNKYKITIFIVLLFSIIFFFVGKNILFEKRAKIATQEYVTILNLISEKKNEEAKKKLEDLKNSKINIYKVLAISKLLEFYKNDKNKQILILDEAISGNIEKNDKDLFKIKKAVLIFESSDENQFFNLLNPSDFKNSPWKILSLEILGDFYLDRGQKNKAKDIYNQALKIENIPEIFKKELEKKTKNLN
jgi:predicted negative regulator of RcsB-dependent stress response